jgi:hypothetical protein
VGLNPPLHSLLNEGIARCIASTTNAAIRRLGLPSVKEEFPTYIVRPGIDDRPSIDDRPIINVHEGK